MYLRYLQYLDAVVEKGSFALAAKACGVSQPAISHGMKALQAHFAQPLLVREGRRYVATDLARAVAARSAARGQRLRRRSGRRLGPSAGQRARPEVHRDRRRRVPDHWLVLARTVTTLAKSCLRRNSLLAIWRL